MTVERSTSMRSFSRRLHTSAIVVVLFGWMAIGTAAAQEADSVQTADTTVVDADSLRALRQVPIDTPGSRKSPGRPIGFDHATYGVAVTDTLPVRLPVMNLAELLGDFAGTFLYRFDTPGWPDGWSSYGLPPQRNTLVLDDMPLNHLFTGRPGFDIAPVAFIEPPRLLAVDLDRPAAVAARVRAFSRPRPVTELKYWKGGEGLESIDAIHAQRRRLPLFGRDGFINVMGSYSGRGSDGEYPGSRLHRGRQVQLRLRYEQPGWSAEIREMHTRRSVGAHGGVIPDGNVLETIYRRIGAVVENEGATRRIVRNDLSGTLRLRLLGAPTSIGAFWTSETFRYRDNADTVGTSSDRIGLRLRQPLPGGLTAEFVGWTDDVDPIFGFGAHALRRSEAHASLRDSLTLFGWTASASAGVHAYDGGVHPGGSIDIAGQLSRMRLSAGGSISGEPLSAVEKMGFRALGESGEGRTGRIAAAYAALAWQGGAVDVALRGFGSRTSDPRDIYMVTDYQADPDSATVLSAPSPIARAGAVLDAGFRRDADRGIYGLVQPSFVTVLNRGDSDLHTRTADALPTVFGRARLGARYLLFRGDLDLDIFTDVYAWGQTTGRALHPETGLLAVPLAGALVFGPSTILNVGAEAGVRGATFFFIYQNALSGTTLMTGNLIVPLYPLPAQLFRFGLYWPIFD